MSIRAKTIPLTKPSGFLAAVAPQIKAVASEPPPPVILSQAETVGELRATTFSTPTSPTTPTSLCLPCSPAPTTRQTSSPFKRGFREALERKFLPPAPRTRRPSPSAAETEPFRIYIWMKIAETLMKSGFASLGALCPIPAGILRFGRAPASSTNLSATSLREPSIMPQGSLHLRRILKVRCGLLSTAKSSPNPKNTPSSSVCLLWDLRGCGVCFVISQSGGGAL